MLEQMVRRLLKKRTFEEAVQTILDDVIALHGAEYGNMQLPIGDELVIAAQRSLSAAFVQTFRRVKRDDGCACGRALRFGASIVIPDVEKDPEFAAFLKDAKSAGFRAVQSTPLFTKDGNLLGLVSTHFAHVHRPTEIEMQALQEYGVLAAEQAYKLLGGVALAAKAAQMAEDLYSGMLLQDTVPGPHRGDHEDVGACFPE
jgi:GAF domain-containing protein